MEKGTTWHEARQIAELIRLEIMYSMELSASVGVSYNLIFSKIGSDYHKPNGITIISKEDYKEIVWPLAASKLLFVGQVREKVLHSHGIMTIGDIANADPVQLARILKSKAGYDLHQYANGNDRNFKPEPDGIGSIGNTITPPADLKCVEDVSAVIYMLATAVSTRLKKHGLKAGCIAVNMRDNQFNTTTRQSVMQTATDGINNIFNKAYELFSKHYRWQRPLRSIGVRATNLDDSSQTSLFSDEDCGIINLDTDINNRLKQLTARFGNLQVECAGALRREQ